jgi:Protein of unknown function (DUF1360)
MKTSAFWNVLFGLFFATLVLSGVVWVTSVGYMHIFIPLEDMVIMSLAIFRLIRLASYDVITKFIRDAVGKAKPDSFLGTFSQLLNCPWCTGLWFSFFVVFGYYLSPLSWPIILILALAGIASFIQVLSNLVGWQAEAKKREVLGSTETSTSKCG